MPGTEELMARLSQLEQGYYGDKEAARQQKFLDTYGSRFSNNRGLGLAILNELDARGIDTSAADEAVQQILDNLRMECQQILDLTKQANEAAIQNAQKIETIANVVDEAVANNPEAIPSDAGEMPAVEPAEVPPALDTMDPDGEFNPDEVPPEEPPAGEEPPAEEPPMPPEEPPAEEVPPEDTVSDARMKRIKRMKDLWGKTRTQKKTETAKAKADNKGSYKPSKGILAACGGER